MALSADLRERVLAVHERREGSQRVLAERFEVAVGTVNNWLRQAREGRRPRCAVAEVSPCWAGRRIRGCWVDSSGRRNTSTE
jgi:transposase-like protein